MTNLEAAYHEAGHCVSAYHSAFHSLAPGQIRLTAYGAGEIYVSLSRRKLAAANKRTDASSETDQEVAASFASVMAAGLVAERIAQERHTQMVANPDCARDDHRFLVKHTTAAGISPDVTQYEIPVTTLLTNEWGAVEYIAQRLVSAKSLDTADVIAELEYFYAKDARG